MMYDKLSKKNCLITGATGGLGREIAKNLIQKNCNLFLTSTNEKKLKLLKKELLGKKENNSKIFVCHSDLCKIDQINNLIKKIKKNMNSIDILINCAGKFSSKSINDLTLKEFENTININVRAPFLLTKNFIKEMKKSKWGRIVYIGSSSSYAGYKNTSAYCASKHGILGFGRAIQEEVKEKNVRVYTFSPGSIKTKMGKKIKEQNYETFMEPNEIADFIVYTISFDSQLSTPEIQLMRFNPK